MHPDVKPLAWLLGTWVGEGEGWYPTVNDFAYREETTWAHGGKPMLAYTQLTWALDDGRSMHGERGFLRVAGGQLEFLLAHANGIVEIETGPIDDVLDLHSVAVVRAPAAKDTSAVSRRIWLDGDVMRYTLDMTAMGQPHGPHLKAALSQKR